MSEDLHNNPPFEILQTELGPENNADVKTYKTGGECFGISTCIVCLGWNLTKNVIMNQSF